MLLSNIKCHGCFSGTDDSIEFTCIIAKTPTTLAAGFLLIICKCDTDL